MGDEKFTVVWSVSCYYSLVVLAFEMFKNSCNQPLDVSLVNLAFALSVFFLPMPFARLAALAIFAWETGESIAWYFTREGLNVQALQAIDVGWVVGHHPEIAWLVLLAMVLLVFMIWFPVPKRSFEVSFLGLMLIVGVAGYSFLFVAWNVGRRLDPLADKGTDFLVDFGLVVAGVSLGRRREILDFLTRELEVSRGKEEKTKNLIILEIESLEYAFLGPLNQGEFPTTMPFTAELVRNGTFVTSAVPQPYTTWSVASMFAVQCNLPMLMQKARRNFQGSFHLNPKLRCLGDFLSLAGYDLYSFQTGTFVGNFKRHLSMHHYHCRDVQEHHFKRDWDLFGYIGDFVLENLSRSVRPWVLHVANADTHPVPAFIVDQRCRERLNGPPVLRSFDCLDQILEKFIGDFKASAVFKDTELVIYGDHLLMAGYRGLQLPAPRHLVIGFPFRARNEISRPVSIYDIAPTVMSVLGLSYEPKFPFGRDIFGSDSGLPPPTEVDFRLIYEFFSRDMNWGPDISCKPGQKGFCGVDRIP